MTISLDALAAEISALRALEGREESSLTDSEFHDFCTGVGRIKKSYDAVAAAMGFEAARRSSPELGAAGWARKEGFSNPQQYLAGALGTTPTEASKLIDAGRALTPPPLPARDALGTSGAHEDSSTAVSEVGATAAPRFPHIARALLGHKIGADAAAMVTRTLEAVERSLAEEQAEPESQKNDIAQLEQQLVEKASSLSLSELRKVCERERARRFPKELAAKEKLQRENRTLFFREDDEGMAVMTARMDVASAAPIKAYIEAQTSWAFRQRRGVEDGGSEFDDPRTPGQIRLDALVSLALHGMGCELPTSGVKTTVVVRISEKDLKDDLALGECDQVAGPITVGTLRLMAVDAGIVPVVLGGKSLPLDVGCMRRLFTPAQRIALVERDGGCSWCHAPPSFCEAHHIRWWRLGGRTDLSNGVMLCTRCHHRVHRDGWTIEVKGDAVWITKPGEPPQGTGSEYRNGTGIGTRTGSEYRNGTRTGTGSENGNGNGTGAEDAGTGSRRIGGKAHLALGSTERYLDENLR